MFRLPSQNALMLIALLCGVLCVCLYIFVFVQHRHTITLTNDGFSPALLRIKTGDTVVFKTELDAPFWPASNLHPTHSLYAAFDPKQPIAPDESWSFTFSKEGTWKFHDHLSPQKTGVILVMSKTGATPALSAACDTLSGSEKLLCFDQNLETRLRTDGIEAAFAYFKDIYTADPEVPSICHGWAHRLGEVEYEAYKEGKEVTLRPEATFCSYGYFHGFINAMVEDTQSLQSAQQFCEDAVQEGSSEFKGMESHCVHGIGHSIATLAFEHQDTWGNVGDVIEKSALECEKLYTTLRTTCFDGVFHELYEAMKRNDYGMDTTAYAQSNDVFYYCRSLEGSLAESCYYAFIPLWPYFLGDDQVAAMRYMLVEIPHVFALAPRVLETFARSFIEMEITRGTFAESVAACAATPQALFTACLKGLAVGFVTHGEPERMHEAGFAFCKAFYEGENKAHCLQFMVEQLGWNYTDAELKRACAELNRKEQPEGCEE